MAWSVLDKEETLKGENSGNELKESELKKLNLKNRTAK